MEERTTSTNGKEKTSSTGETCDERSFIFWRKLIFTFEEKEHVTGPNFNYDVQCHHLSKQVFYLSFLSH